MQKILDLIVKPWVNIDYSRALEKEKEIGYKLKLNKLSPNWINGQMVFDMTSIWNKAGIKAEGVNYFTIGTVKNNISSRFDYKSSYYQAWFGGYIVKFSKSRKWTINDHFKLSIADQETWLNQYGDPNPYAEIDYEHIIKHKSVCMGAFKAQLFEGSIYSHTDVGEGRRSILFPFFMTGFAQSFNKSKPTLKVRAKYLIPPKWSNKIPIESFQKIRLHGYVTIVNISKFIKAVIYANGAFFKDLNGKSYNTFKKINPELKAMIEDIEIVKVHS